MKSKDSILQTPSYVAILCTRVAAQLDGMVARSTANKIERSTRSAFPKFPEGFEYGGRSALQKSSPLVSHSNGEDGIIFNEFHEILRRLNHAKSRVVAFSAAICNPNE